MTSHPLAKLLNDTDEAERLRMAIKQQKRLEQKTIEYMKKTRRPS